MFSMFSLLKPDVMPLGDLGVRRGILYMFDETRRTKGNPGSGSSSSVREKEERKRCEELTKSWGPFSSLGAAYMWRVTDTGADGGGKDRANGGGGNTGTHTGGGDQNTDTPTKDRTTTTTTSKGLYGCSWTTSRKGICDPYPKKDVEAHTVDVEAHTVDTNSSESTSVTSTSTRTSKKRKAKNISAP
jgi:hypothetical protein